MEKLYIDDVIVVEGRHDAQKVSQVVEALILITHGTHISNEFLEQLESLSKKHSIIIFTDNDTPGKYIREKISSRIQNVKHAKIHDKQADVGVEHASFEQILDALSHCVSYSSYQPIFTMNDLYILGLNGKPSSATLREAVTYHYRLPKMNAKALLKALNHLNISYEELETLCQNQSLLQ
jgi:ribonuclease M5